MENYYTVLNISETASLDEIKRAYKKLALKYHPDRNADNLEMIKSAEENFKRINEAYQTLSDPHKKAVYDATLRYKKTQREQFFRQYTSTGYENQQQQQQQGQYHYQRRQQTESQRSKSPLVFGRMEIYALAIFAVIAVVAVFAYNILATYSFTQHIEKAKVAIQNGQWANATIYLYQANENKPDQAIYFFLSGKIKERYSYEEAIQLYNQAIELEEDLTISISYQFAKANALRQNGQPQQAIEEYKRIHFSQQRNTDALLEIAQIYLHDLKDYDKASLYFDKVIAQNPTFRPAYEGKLKAKQATKDTEAIEEITKQMKEL